ncbi:MAG TPA: aminodeoxychorismate/anthranilate synthase component II [Candidatus Polarisedimenticolaceae bacterium]|nr:aminodeoxychorismate/anthranilate synthase component II [Candidatus Polarisedimenticolaceae bacterium]
MARLLLLDNYDSFSWNLVQYLAELGADVDVKLHDEVDVSWCVSQRFDAIVISPGPGRPEGAGISMDLIREVGGSVPLLGVCLGHQAIARVYGAEIIGAPTLMHGKTSPIVHDGRGIFAGLTPSFEATRYHSLVVDESTLDPTRFLITARTPEGVIMAIEHRRFPVFGVQFHPESVLTLEGKRLLGNFLGLAAANREQAV